MDRALGNPLGNPLGLARAAGSAWQPERSSFTRIVSGSGVLTPPEGAKLMRVAVIGGGGGGKSGYPIAGGGGGCAATRIVPASAVSYEIGSGGYGANNSSGGDTLASFGAYTLVGGGGKSGLGGGAGGAGLGGDVNFRGGNGASVGGGGAAGPNGRGADAVNNQITAGEFAGTGWGVGGGGANGYQYTYSGNTYGCGGGGAGAPSGRSAVVGTGLAAPGTPWGVHGGVGISSYGGEMGGGAPTGAANANGGSGGLVVEWFY